MALKKYNPVTPSLREKLTIDKTTLWSGKPFKKLTKGLIKTGGRNNQGRITMFHIGGGHKRLYRIVDFKRTLFNTKGIVKRIEYDPNRSAWIALIVYENGIISYILAPNGLIVGDSVISGEKVDIKTGNALPLKNIPIGTLIHNIELKPGKGGQLSRSAGTYAQLIRKDEGTYAMLRLSSGEQRLVSMECMASIGIVSNLDNQNVNYGKAGTTRWKNRRPVVRGVAMNPVDHPHGGGEGRTSGGRSSVTPWGKPTKGKATRSVRKKNPFILTKRK